MVGCRMEGGSLEIKSGIASEIRGDTLSIELTAGEMMAEDDAKENQSGKNNNLLHPVI